MTCKIERSDAGNKRAVLRVCGHLQVEHLSMIERLIRRETDSVTLDLAEVTLVDRDAVVFLADCVRKGIKLRNCPAFIQEWVAKGQ